MKTIYAMTTLFLIGLFATALVLGQQTKAEITLPKIATNTQNSVSQAIKKARAKARTLAINTKKPVISTQTFKTQKPNTQAQQQVIKKLLNQTLNNKDWQQKQQQFSSRIYTQQGVEAPINNHHKQHRLYLFISSSLPKDKLRNYAKQLSKIPNSQIIMRGFIGGAKKMSPTMQFIKSIITKDKDCQGIGCKTYPITVNIDPILFNRYQISKVPILVYVDEFSGALWCSEGNSELTTAKGIHKFTGLAPIKYMLRELAQQSNNQKLLTIYKEYYDY